MTCDATREKVVFTSVNLCGCAVVSGAIISFAVLSSQLVGPTWGGILSVFPAVFISTFIIAYDGQGVEFARSLTKPLMMSGMINVPAYAIVVRYLYPWAGLAWGTGLSFVVAMVTTYCTCRYATTLKNKLFWQRDGFDLLQTGNVYSDRGGPMSGRYK